jgi:Fe-S cluster biogenesis protein NfuA
MAAPTVGVTEEEIASAVQLRLDGAIRPLLQFHGGDVRIERITQDGVVHLEYHGACRGCYLQAATHFVTVRLRLLEVPGVTEVVARGVRLSEESAGRIAQIYGTPGSRGP